MDTLSVLYPSSPAPAPPPHAPTRAAATSVDASHGATGAMGRHTLIARAAARRAAAYLDSHRDRHTSVGELAAACATSVRSLYRGFEQEFGTSPLRYQKQARLDCIRADLLSAAPGATVTHVAFRWGVTHLGRFAQEYARRFGEAPSATLKRACSARLLGVMPGHLAAAAAGGDTPSLTS
jgi:AraC-like DNA-binding protein